MCENPSCKKENCAVVDMYDSADIDNSIVETWENSGEEK